MGMVTNGEHDQMMRDQRVALNSMATSMRRQNYILGLKELFAIGAISEIDYRDTLAQIVCDEGCGVKSGIIKKEEAS